MGGKDLLYPVFWFATRAGKILGIARIDSAQENHCLERTYQVRKLWTVSVMESQKMAEDSQTEKT